MSTATTTTPASSTQRGAHSQLVAATWFTDRGWQVYFGFGQTDADFVIIQGPRIFRVEVRTVTVQFQANKSGGGTTNRLAGRVDETKFDWLVLVDQDGRVLEDHSGIRVPGYTGQAPEIQQITRDFPGNTNGSH